MPRSTWYLNAVCEAERFETKEREGGGGGNVLDKQFKIDRTHGYGIQHSAVGMCDYLLRLWRWNMQCTVHAKGLFLHRPKGAGLPAARQMPA